MLGCVDHHYHELWYQEENPNRKEKNAHDMSRDHWSSNYRHHQQHHHHHHEQDDHQEEEPDKEEEALSYSAEAEAPAWTPAEGAEALGSSANTKIVLFIENIENLHVFTQELFERNVQ